MRNLIRFVLVVLLAFNLSSVSWPGPVRVGAQLNYYQLADPIFKDVYGKGNLQYGISFGYSFEQDLHPIAKRSEFYLEADYFADQGNMTVTKEKVSFSIMSLLIGVRLRIINAGSFKPYLGIGGGAYFFKEDVPARLEDVSESAREIHVESGMYIAVTKRISLDLNFRYAFANAEPFKELIKLGGMRAGLGIGFRL